MRSRNTLLLRLLALALLSVSAPPIFADVGLPMIVVVWPIAWLALVPVVLLEAIAYHRDLGGSFPTALMRSGLTNLLSTALGIPLAWGLPLATPFLFSYFHSTLPSGIDEALGFLLWPFWLMPWDDRAIQSLSVPLALALLLPLFLAASVFSEAWLLRRLLPPEQRSRALPTSLRANCWSYTLLALLLLIEVIAARIGTAA
jgi:hypothetical protein